MKFSHRFWAAALSLALLGSAFFYPIHADAAKKKRGPTAAEIAAAEQAEQERQDAYNKAIDSNQIEGWPQGPQIYAESAIVIEADTGAVLYNKDMDMRNYPASITKIMTALVTLEHCSLDEVVTYSYYATHSIEAGSSSIGRTDDEQLTVEESLYGLLLESANECGNALAEHVAGSVEAFADLMNQKAEELGCTNTHFVNPHGLHDENHYTSAHDMALIMKAAIQNENFVRISGTPNFELHPTNKHDEITYMKNHHYMIGPYKGITKYLDDTVIAGKTGGTSAAKRTLVTAAERGGMTLIVVTMRTGADPSGELGLPLFPDTALLLNYASENFSKINVAANETNFSVNSSGFFHTGSAIFGQMDPLIEINKNDYIVLPNDIPFTEASPELTFQSEEDSETIATLAYTWQGQPVGSASIQLAQSKIPAFSFDRETGDPESPDVESSPESQPKKFIQINVRLVLTGILIAAAVVLLCILFQKLSKQWDLMGKLRRFRLSKRRKRKKRRRVTPRNRYQRTPKKRNSPYSDLDL
ncbi:MAG: D-alanyl-D-alanine carboxypeptidase [Lachnospiraceae bacterium]|jgi:D-alanyl-D-alanine carboxypeptidase (penicillin-binding protein 5/6)|nr:D-alanyl-D-alanine carboxypeptidase [Lachnospiraceae bacterium]